MEWSVEMPDRRTVAVEDAGDRQGRPVLVHVGTPGSRRLYGDRTLADAERRGIRLISYDRPGYGDSTPHPGRTTADCAVDVRAICETLAIERLAMWGLSGGGPHALACAALLPDLVVGVAALASLAPIDALGLDWLAGFSQPAIDETHLMRTDEPAARALFERERQEILAATPEEFARDPRSGGADPALLAEELVSIHQALRPGIEGAWDDCVSQLTPWGFDVADIRVPVLVLHGAKDKAVPFTHGQWLASHVPTAQNWFFEEEGHGLRERHIEDVHAWLLDRWDARPSRTKPT